MEKDADSKQTMNGADPLLFAPHLKDFLEFIPALNRESERGAVLISCSFLDALMGRILLACFVDRERTKRLLEGFNAPLGTFSTRVSAAYALALISEREFKECETLRRIRNRFAHDVHASFDDQDLRSLTEALTMAAPDHETAQGTGRARFTTSAIMLILNLTNRPAYVARERRQPKDWPY